MSGIGSHQSARMKSETWLTPPWVLHQLTRDLGPFDLDPCAALDQPWVTARDYYTVIEDGLQREWRGSVWLNPPYGKEAGRWLARMAEHGDGVALLFARTETDMFFRWVWEHASAILFLCGRLHFHHINGSRAKANAGGPSVLAAYGPGAVERLVRSEIPGSLVNRWRVEI